MDNSFCLEDVTILTDEQCGILYDMFNNLPLIADLTQADIFIDCLLNNQDAAIVVAEAKPCTTQSLYKNSVVGQIAYEDSEPGVLFSLKTGKPVIGSKGISQENVVMQQDIVPIKDSFHQTIAVLIKERDISQEILNEQKVKTLMNSKDNKEKDDVLQSVIVQEIHHRVKNNLQIITSLLRLQKRRCSSSSEAVEVLRDSISRISSMAIVHDYLAQHGIEKVDTKFVMEQISALLISLSNNQEKKFNVSVQGESLFLPSDITTSVVLVVNELVQNCIKHAFPDQQEGKIEINVNSRKQMAYITVKDNGQGLKEKRSDLKTSPLGLQLVEMLVEEKLQGDLSFFYSKRGTKVSLTFPISDKVM